MRNALVRKEDLDGDTRSYRVGVVVVGGVRSQDLLL